MFNQKQALILVAANKQTIPDRFPQPLAPPARGEPAQPQGLLANLLHRGGREVGQDINLAGQNSLPDNYLAFLHNTVFVQGTINSMRQRVLLSWMGNTDDADPVNALNNLLHVEHDDASTQVLGEPEAIFGAPAAGAQNNNNQHQAANNMNAPPHGLAAPGGADHRNQEQAHRLGAAQQQFEHQGGKYTHTLSCFHDCIPIYSHTNLLPSIPLYHMSVRASRFSDREWYARSTRLSSGISK